MEKGKPVRQHFRRLEMAFLQLFSEFGPAARIYRGLVKSPAEGSNALGILCRMAGAAPMSLLQVHSGKSADFSDGLLTYTAVRKTRTRIRKHRPASLSHWQFAQALLVDPSRLKRVGVVGFDCWHLPLMLGTGDMVTGEEGQRELHMCLLGLGNNSSGKM